MSRILFGKAAETAEIAVVEEGSVAQNELEGKIALIQRADPGFDWLFSRGITGLLTAFGGANSHMAIRAAEFGLPAAIGIGMKRYEELASAGIVTLDCRNRLIKIEREKLLQ